MATTRPVRPDDLAAVVALLTAHLDTSLFLLSNLETGGLEDRGDAYQATWVATFDRGRVTAVAAACWNGIVLVQGSAGLEEATREAVSRAGRDVTGIAGAWPLVVRATTALGLDDAPAVHGDPEVLFALETHALRVPPALASGDVVCRRPRDDEIDPVLVDWRVAYSVETLGAALDGTLRDRVRGELLRLQALGRHWVLEHRGTLVSYTGFNAWTHGVAQVGGVWTPPELRGRGYARAGVAGSLLAARKKGTTRSVLFTDRANVAAQRAYMSLGYVEAGEYGLLLLR
jgi:GNAT superfamily N-acetyltransferase